MKRRTHDYHPPLQDVKNLGDCGICMDSIILSSNPQEDDEDLKSEKGSNRQAVDRFVQSMTDKKSYSVAPCQHIFVRTLLYVLTFDHTLIIHYSIQRVWNVG